MIMLHPVMTIRPDEIVRSGIVQPFSVRSMDPVQFARHEVDPFIRALRPMGAYGPQATAADLPTIDGSLGIVTADRMPLAGLGQENSGARLALSIGGGVVGGIFLGLLGGYVLFGRRRRRR